MRSTRIGISMVVGVLLLGGGWGMVSFTSIGAASADDVSEGNDSIATTWLTGSIEERLVQIERQLRGMDSAMAEIGYRYGELVHAAKNREWEYADYQAEHIFEVMELALVRRPARAKSAQTFMTEDLPAVREAIQVEDEVYLDSAMTRLHNSCVECHQAEDVLFFRNAVERIRDRALK